MFPREIDKEEGGSSGSMRLPKGSLAFHLFFSSCLGDSGSAEDIGEETLEGDRSLTTV